MKYKQGDKVFYDVQGVRGEAIICGGWAGLLFGANYILQDLSGNFPNKTYAYTHFTAFECWLRLVG